MKGSDTFVAPARASEGCAAMKFLSPTFVTVVLTLLTFSPTAAQAQVEDLSNPQPKRRIRAAKQLANANEARFIPELAKLLKDPVVDVRLEAVSSITQIGTQDSLGPLITATRDASPEMQVAAVDGLVNFYSYGYVKTGWFSSVKDFGGSIKNRFSRPEPVIIDPYVQVNADVINAIGRIIVGGSSMESRANAARAAGILRGKGAVPQLQEALLSKNTMLILEAVNSLKKIGDTSAGPAMVFLLRDLDKDVKLATIQAMGQLQVSEAIPELVGIVKTSDDKRTRREALIALAKLPDNGQQELFRLYLRDRDSGIRAAAAEGIGRVGDAGNLKLISEAFAREKNESARLSMAFAAVALGDLNNLSYLIDGLNSSIHRGEARPFLVELARKPEVLAKLYDPLTTGTIDQKRELAEVIAWSGTRESLPYLEKLSQDSNTQVAQAAIQAMKNLQARL
jgi:HEAT repeat protein